MRILQRNPVATILTAMILVSLAVPFGWLSFSLVKDIEIGFCVVAYLWGQALRHRDRKE